MFARLGRAPPTGEHAEHAAVLDEWMQWKTPKTKHRDLVAVGTDRDSARDISGSRKGLLAALEHPQVSKALGLAYSRRQELISLVEAYRHLRCA